MDEPRHIQITVPDALAGGVYANGAGVWHTAHEFTLDFLSLLPTDPKQPDVLPATVVSRIKIPVTVIFDLMRALNTNMSEYEAKFGAIKRVEPRAPDGPQEGTAEPDQ